MPELPEAEIARRQLHRWLSGRRVRIDLVDSGAIRTELTSKPSRAAPEGLALLEAVATQPAEEPSRHGKRIGWPWGDRGLLVHLGMSGKFVRREDSERPPFARLGWIAEDASVWFVDRRRFGCVVAVDRESLEHGLRKGHGPDALDEAPDAHALAEIFGGRSAIKTALMDQSKLAGVGNIQAAEALFTAGIDPRTSCSEITAAQWKTLAIVIPAQLQKVIDAEDAGEIEYMTEGARDNPFQVYKREGEPCPVCTQPIVLITQGGRSTFFCGTCQS